MLQKITLVSAYGRAHWLAKELATHGYKVSLIDVTEKLGIRSPELWENPFGVFHSQRINNSQKAWLSDSTMVDLKKGFTLLLPTGPVEFLGPLKNHFFKKMNFETMAQNILKASTSSEDRKTLVSQILETSFADWWGYYFAYNCASTKYQHNFKSFLNGGVPLPILDNWSLRLTTRRSFDVDLENLGDRGVRIIKNESVLGIEKEGRKIKSLKLTGDIIAADNYFFFLSQEEIQYLNKDIAVALFQNNLIRPQWYWSKYRILVKPTWVSDSFPKAFVMVDPFLPWSHHEMIVVHRGSMMDEFNLWVRIPYQRRFDMDYLKKIGERIQIKFLEKCPQTMMKDFELPVEFGASSISMGPPPFPVFDTEALKASSTPTFDNSKVSGPEQWDRLDWESVLSYQNEIFNNIQMSSKTTEKVRRRGRDLEIYS